MAPITLISAFALLALTTTAAFVAAEPKHHARQPHPQFMKRGTGGYYPTGTSFGTGTGYARLTGTGFSTSVFPPSISVPIGGPSATSVAGASATGDPGPGFPGSGGPGGAGGNSQCAPPPVTVTVQNTQTVTVAASATGAGAGASGAFSQPAGPPYSIPGQSVPAGGPTASTGVASASAPSGSVYPTGTFGVKRGLEMRGSKQDGKMGEKEKREGWWFA